MIYGNMNRTLLTIIRKAWNWPKQGQSWITDRNSECLSQCNSSHWDDLGAAPNTPASLSPTLSKLKTCTGQWLENTHIQAPTERNPWAIMLPGWKMALNANLKATFVWHLHLEIPAYCRGHNLICQCWQENIRAYPQNVPGGSFSAMQGSAMHTLGTVWGFPTKSPSISSLEKKGGNELRK